MLDSIHEWFYYVIFATPLSLNGSRVGSLKRSFCKENTISTNYIKQKVVIIVTQVTEA